MWIEKTNNRTRPCGSVLLQFLEPDLCPILTPAEIRHLRNRFPKSSEEISNNAPHKVSTLPQWDSNVTQPATTTLVAAVSSTTTHTQSPTSPPRSVKRVCTHLLMRKQGHPAPSRLGSRGPLGSHVWQLLVKLIPPTCPYTTTHGLRNKTSFGGRTGVTQYIHNHHQVKTLPMLVM